MELSAEEEGRNRKFTGCLLEKSQALGPDPSESKENASERNDKGRDIEHIDLPVVGSTRPLELENPGSCLSAHHQVSKNRSTQIGFPQTLVY